MDKWLKNAVMLVVTVIWTLYMMTFLILYVIGKRADPPEPALWGVPGGIYCMLNPPFRFSRKADPKATEQP